MNKSIWLVILAGFVALLIGCHAGGSAPFINVPSESDILSFEREVDENGRFADITFPSGAVIKCTQDGTLKKGTKITATEQKNSNGTPSYIYNITGKLFTDDAMNTAVSVNTLEKPISVTLPNNSTTGTCYIGTRASESDPWRYSLATDGLANIRFARLQASTPSQCNFNLYRLGISFALFVLNNQSKEETEVDSVEITPTEKVEYKDGKYVADLKVKVKVSGEKLDGIKADGLIARIIYRSNNQTPVQLKANGSIVKQTDSDDKAVSGTYEYSFEVSNIKIESQMSGEAVLSFVLNLDGISLEDFPTSFLVEFYSNGKAENTLPFTYTQAFSFETKEQQDNPQPEHLVTYSITYDLGNGQKTLDNPTSYTEETESFTLNNPERKDFTFLGWTGSNGNTPQTEVKIEKGSTGDRSYTANWSPDIYEITYNNIDFCTFEEDNPTTYDVTSASITLTNPTRTGCEFLGWTYEGQTTPTKTVKIEKGTTGNKEFTANFKLNLTLTIAQDEGVIIDDANKLYYTKPSFTIKPSLVAGAQLTDTEKATILAALSVKDSENKSVSDISAVWNNNGNIALAFSKDLTASTTFTISLGDIDGVALTCKPFNFKTFYYKGKGTTQVPYQVENDEQLDLIREYLSCHFIQTEDINLANRDWEAIGSMVDKFTGSYDGNQKKIEKFTTSNGSGLFYMVSNGGKISNITVDGVSISNGLGEIGIIAWGLDANCSIENCVVTDSSAASRSDTNSNITGGSIGGICNTNYGSIKSCIIEKCNINNTVTSSIGGICFDNTNSGSIESCQVKDCNIKSTSSTTSMNDSIGGICRYNSGSVAKCDLINSCISLSHTDEYSGDYKGRVGGICCSSDGKINNCSVKNSEISCSTSSGIMKIGGICNSYTNDTDFLTSCSIENTTIKGLNPKGECNTGGICSEMENSKIESCYITGSTITASGKFGNLGGIVAISTDTQILSCNIQNTKVCGEDLDYDLPFYSIGGIAGKGNGNSIQNCYIANNTQIIGTGSFASVGGIGGYGYNISNCYVNGSIVTGDGVECKIGGIGGSGTGEQSIEKCRIENNTRVIGTIKECIAAGIGCFKYNITDCYVDGSTITADGNGMGCYAGGIAGSALGSANPIYITSCYINNTQVSAKSSVTDCPCHVGRICALGNFIITNSYVVGSIIIGEGYNTYIGGIIGEGKNRISKSYVKNSEISESSDNQGGNIGGIIGYAYNDITSCYLLNSNVKACGNNTQHSTNYVGGICGYLSGNITSCYVIEEGSHSISKINPNGGGKLGYLVGYRNNTTIKDSFYNGTVDPIGDNVYDISGSNSYSGVDNYNDFKVKVWSDTKTYEGGSTVWDDDYQTIDATSWPPTLKQN